MKIREEQKIVLLSIVGGLLLWGADAGIDSWVFHQGRLLNTLFLNVSTYELFFRVFMVLGLVVFGLVIANLTRKRRHIEERYKNLVELSSDIIYVSDKKGNQIFMNDAAYRMLERTPEEVVGRPMIDLIHPDDREKTLQKRNELASKNAQAFNFENRYITKSGKAITVLHNVRVLRDEKGEFAGTQGIARDITMRKLVENDLKRAVARIEDEKAKSEAIVAAIGDAISIQDRDFRVIYQNRLHQQLVGGDKTGEYCYRAYSQIDHICEVCPVAEAMKDGGIHTVVKTLARDKTRTIEITASPLRDSSGNIVSGIEAVRDITERKHAQERLTLFSEAVEEAMDGMQIVGLDGVIIYSNKAVRELYGFSPEELKGRHVNEMNADPDFAGRVILPQLRNAGRWSGELMVKHKDGGTFPVWLSTSLVKDGTGKPIAMVGIIRDITERKQAEEILYRHRKELVKLVEERTKELTLANEKLRKEIADREKMEEELLKAQKLESLGILAGGIAHDFNNLLASMLGNISLAMLDLDRDHGAYQQLLGAEKASLRAQDLTRQLLTFSKGGAPVKKTNDIVELVKEAAGFALRGSRVKCEFDFEEGLRPADVDEGQISQVIHNLVINADHAMPEGGTVSVRCTNFSNEAYEVLPLKKGKYVRISIEDHGVGITKEHLPKIFDPYFTTKQKGSGLGLATAYSIIRKHGGHIAVESEVGVGTTFSVYVPASSGARPSAKPAEGVLRKGTGTILVMDDEEAVRETTGSILKRLGYEVTCAADGSEAVALYRQARDGGKPFDVVIMDLTVPGGLGGKETLIKLRKEDPGIKAIVSSGYSNDPIMADFKKHGFSGVVTKPYRIKELSDELHRIIAGEG